MRAVAEIAAEPFAAGNQQTCHIVEHPAGHLSLKKLIANDASRLKDGETSEFLVYFVKQLRAFTKICAVIFLPACFV